MTQWPRIGAFVLETLTTGMYTNPLDTIREFVQNSADSLRKAEEACINDKRSSRIEIDIDDAKRAIRIRDNGLGVPRNEVARRLLNIGMSDKKIGTDSGFRGIGRLAGIAYCRTMTFRTTALQEPVASAVGMDCDSIRKAISPSLREAEELAEVIARNCKISTEPCAENDHFFEVSLEGISDAASVFLDWLTLRKYLGQVAPVGFDAQRFLFATEIEKWVEQHGIALPTVTLVIRSGSVNFQVFKPYKGRYKTRMGNYPVEIKDICFHPEELSSDTPYWIWYGKTDLLGTIDDQESSGFRIRKNNISLGLAERAADLFAEISETNRRFNFYYVGEIHVLSPEAIPNARRDGFEDAGSWPAIKQSLRPFIVSRCEEIRATSDARNRPAAKVISSARKVINEAKECLTLGIVSPSERDSLLKQIEKEQKRVLKALEASKNGENNQEFQPLLSDLDEVRKSLSEQHKFGTRALRSDLDRRQRKLVLEIIQVLEGVLDESSFKKAKSAILTKFGIDRSKS